MFPLFGESMEDIMNELNEVIGRLTNGIITYQRHNLKRKK